MKHVLSAKYCLNGKFWNDPLINDSRHDCKCSEINNTIHVHDFSSFLFIQIQIMSTCFGTLKHKVKILKSQDTFHQPDMKYLESIYMEIFDQIFVPAVQCVRVHDVVSSNETNELSFSTIFGRTRWKKESQSGHGHRWS